MSNVRLSWTLPTPNVAQRPISHVLVDARVSIDLPWTNVARVDAPGNTVLIQDVAPGEWFYRGSVVDTDGNVSDPSVVSVFVAFDGPSALVDFAATVE